MTDTDAACNAMLADWLAGIFERPQTEHAVAVYRTAPGRAFLERLAEEPAAARGVTCMLAAVTAAPSSATATRNLSLSFTHLFSGLDPQKTVSLYESAHVSPSGRLFQQPVSDMDRLLRQMRLQVTSVINEPPDHLSIEMGLLAECFRREDRPGVAELLGNRLRAWVPAFARACRQADAHGFYGGAATLLSWFVNSLGHPKMERQNGTTIETGASP